MVVIETHIVAEGTEKIRFYDYACKTFKSIPSNKGIKKAITSGFFYIDGEIAKTGTWVKTGQRIELVEPDRRPTKTFEYDLEIIFQDEFIAVINKPAGIEVSGNKFQTIENALLYNIQLSKEKDALNSPKPVHRLDYATSGLLLIAKTTKARIELGRMFEEREIKKRYSAIVIGKIESQGTIKTEIDNQASLTEYRLVKHVPSLTNEWLSHVDLFPHTGRKHQLRKHMAEIGHPIMGDKLYQNKGQMIKGKGMFLCAVELTFVHPVLEEKMNFIINEPNKFESFLLNEKERWERLNH